MSSIGVANLRSLGKWTAVYSLCGKTSIIWGGMAVATGLFAFAFDFLFAISLQRFFITIGLIQGGDETTLLGPLRSLPFEIALFLVAGIGRSMVVWLNSVATGISQVAFEAEARRKISQWALWEGNASTGRVSTLFNDTVVCSGAAASTSYYLVGRILMIIASLLTLLYYSSTLTAVLLLLLVLASPLHRGLDRRITHASANIQRSLANVSDRLMRGVKNSIFLHIHGILAREIAEQRAMVGNYEHSSRQYYALASARGIVPQVLGIAVVALIATQGSGVFTENKGDLVAYLYLVMRFFQTLSDAARVTANIRGNWPRLEILSGWYRNEFQPELERMDRETRESDESGIRIERIGVLLDDVTYAWSDGSPVLSSANLEFPAGTITVVLGPSGIGKTTLLLLLARIVVPQKGKVVVDLQDGRHDLGDIRRHLLSATAYVGPDPFMIAGSVRDFLLYGQSRNIPDADLVEALSLAHCDFVADLPNGLDHRIAEQGAGLSAGQKQRLSIARALLRQPRLLLLDEATSNLDAESEQAIIDTIRLLKGRVTVVAVTHREALKTVADSVVTFLGDGRISVEQPQSEPAATTV